MGYNITQSRKAERPSGVIVREGTSGQSRRKFARMSNSRKLRQSFVRNLRISTSSDSLRGSRESVASLRVFDVGFLRASNKHRREALIMSKLGNKHFIAVLAALACMAVPADTLKGRVVKVADGDTVPCSPRTCSTRCG